MQKLEFKEESEIELTKAIINKLPFLSRFDVQKILENKDVKVNNARVKENITLKKGTYTLNIKAENNTGNRLIAPVKGNMSKDIIESITSSIYINLRKENHIIFSDMSSNCGLEIV